MALTKQLRIGVLLVDTVQFLDAAPIDILGMLSKSYLTSHGFPSTISSLGVDSLSIIYIHPTSIESRHHNCYAPLTADAELHVDRSLASSDCAPGQLDILVIPGPKPGYQSTDDVKAFVRAHAAVEKTIIMTVCIGVFVAAQAGILCGKTATGTGAFIPELKAKFKDVNWVTRRWVADGKFWTSGTITNGNDMMAAFIKKHYPGPLSDTICSATDVGDRGQDFPPSN